MLEAIRASVIYFQIPRPISAAYVWVESVAGFNPSFYKLPAQSLGRHEPCVTNRAAYLAARMRSRVWVRRSSGACPNSSNISAAFVHM
jgi:hypothetical protein